MSARKDKLRIQWIAMSTDTAAGYGKIGSYLPAALQHAGCVNLGFRDTDWDWRIAVGGPRAWLFDRHLDRADDIIWHSMFEARPLPPDWPPILNRCAAVWLPTTWNVDVYRESGVTVPLIVAGYGVNDNYFQPKTRIRDEDEPYTFMWAGTSLGDGANIGDRKGGELVVKAFRALNLPNSRLVLKVTFGSAIKRLAGDPRIMILVTTLTEPDYAALLAGVDCFVYPSRGEGFGLQPLEAMAVGLPVIAPAYSGLADFIQSDTAIVLPTRGEALAHLYKHIYAYDCMWADISVDDVADRMRWAYDHRAEAQAIGCRAAALVKAQWTWRHAGRRALKALRTLRHP